MIVMPETRVTQAEAIKALEDVERNMTATHEALDLALHIIMRNEPPDSRTVSDEAVAIAAVACGDISEPVMQVIRRALAEEKAREH